MAEINYTEPLCPKCKKETMKEWVHQYKCRNLDCRLTLKKVFPPCPEASKAYERAIKNLEKSWDGSENKPVPELKLSNVYYELEEDFFETGIIQHNLDREWDNLHCTSSDPRVALVEKVGSRNEVFAVTPGINTTHATIRITIKK